MKKLLKSLLSVVLVLSMMLGTSMSAFAASNIREEYLSDLRLIYADSYEEAKEILTETSLEGYKILNSNLNASSGVVNTLLGNTGVWLAYKTTTDIDDAITDIAIMQMGGGYSVGNYQEMIAQSYEEYLVMGEIYLDAIDYFIEAYDAEDFMALAAYRQLNFYNGMDKYSEDRLGDLLVDGILRKGDLATLFFEGNPTVAKNIRQLIALGVSYNEDGMHYLEKVGEAAAEMIDDPTVFDGELDDELVELISTSIPVFKNMFTELSAYEAEMNYEDDEFTSLELKYAEYKSIADRMRATEYLDGKTLYDFCMEYDANRGDKSVLYPLVAALNDGQAAMTKVCHYYDVVRYSMTEAPEEMIDSEITALEETYSEKPISVYLGVDRDLYDGSFAITSAASRADAYTGSTSLGETLFGNGAWVSTSLQIATGAVGVGLAVWAIYRTVKGSAHYAHAADMAARATDVLKNEATASAETFMAGNDFYSTTLEELREYCIGMKWDSAGQFSDEVWNTLSYGGKIEALANESGHFTSAKAQKLSTVGNDYHSTFLEAYEDAATDVYNAAMRKAQIFTGVVYLLSAAALTYSAISIYNKIYDYYHPEYEEVPVAMVDLVKTADGDRYIKYDVVYEAKTKDGKYHAGDLNAYKGERWNAVYYTKNSEAGNPLLADFEVSDNNNRAEKGYVAVHRFGEVVCYDMNKYNFSGNAATVFMSVAQSENKKSDVTSVPDVVGSIFGTGFWLIAGSMGALVGVIGTLGTQSLLKKKKTEGEADSETAE